MPYKRHLPAATETEAASAAAAAVDARPGFAASTSSSASSSAAAAVNLVLVRFLGKVGYGVNAPSAAVEVGQMGRQEKTGRSNRKRKRRNR